MRGPFSIPQGAVLKAFGITSSATQLDGFTDMAQATLDLLPWFQLSNRQQKKETTAVAAVAMYLSSALSPPANKIWLVERLSVRASAGAAEIIRLGAAHAQVVQGGAFCEFKVGAESSSSLTDAAGVGIAVSSSDRPFLVNGSASDRLGFFVHKITTAGAIDVETSVVFWEFDA